MKPHLQTTEEYELDNRIFLELLMRAAHVKGDFVELGVYKGNSLIEILSEAARCGKMVHAFDSFRGFAKPSKQDFEPESMKTLYPKGRLDLGGPNYLTARLAYVGFSADYYTIWEGFIPKVFKRVPDNFEIAFAYVDLDHYNPTRHALAWVWERLSPQGIMLCDDFFDDELWGCASLAITQFISGHVDEFDIVRRTSRRIAFKKR